MAKTNKNILGDQRGKIGKVVGRVVEGEQMYSSAPGPRGSEGTAKQKEHRARFSAITRMGKPLKGAIKIGMKVSASKKHLQSPFNLFVNRNLQHTTYNAETGLATPDYEAIILSEGDIPFVTFAEPTFTEPQTITITFNGNSDCPGAMEEDIIYGVAYCPDLVQSAMGTAVRSAETLTITVPKTWTGKTIHIWGFAKTSVTRVIEIENYGMVLVPDACSVSAYVGSGEGS
jgi:hypothetical protein